MVRAGRWIAAAWIMATAWIGTTAVAAPPQPKLVVAIAVDQFSAELFQRYRPSFTGGL